MAQSTEALVRTNIAPGDLAHDPHLNSLLAELQRRFDRKLLAVILYGSYLRGKRDTLLDFYVLLEDFEHTMPRVWQRLANVILPPNVYYLSVDADATADNGQDNARAKYATLRLTQLEKANREDFHSYFWARFTQPCRLVFCRDNATEQRIVSAISQAAHTFIDKVLPLLPDRFNAAQLWQLGFSLTYQAELRAERQDKLADLYNSNATYLDALANTCLSFDEDGCVDNPSTASPRVANWLWRLRRWQGKLLSILRLIKAAGTFNDPLDYLLWKIQRHSGIYIHPTERQRRYPLIFAWGLLWRLYRRGAFR